ncbi:MAG: adenylyltransferase/cytidyltransferase family protein [Candidatus Lindowbacteria bacterium]|nr:adenylyltransferase/cytidyltransferase family protein [Candidatus Lindowbacteria bacterium]
MKYLDKISTIDQLSTVCSDLRGEGQQVVLCHGCFDILHPGHLRYLAFAKEQGDILVVTVTADSMVKKGPDRPFVPEELRAEALAALGIVDFVAVDSNATAVETIEVVKPDIYVKGKEYENSDDHRFVNEKKMVESHGGRVIFSSGDVVYSSTHLIRAFKERLRIDDARWVNLCQRHGITRDKVREIFERMEGLKFLVVGDAIVDEYLHCDVLGVASESPVLNLAKLGSEKFVGGAGVIACHLARLGCSVRLVSVLGDDLNAQWLRTALEEEGVENDLISDVSRPTVKKSRFLVEEQKVMKVDDYRRHPLDSTIQRELLDKVSRLLTDVDGIIFGDFGYGVLSDKVIGEICEALSNSEVQKSAVTSTSLRGNILRFSDMDLITPTEREARTSLGDFDSGLSVIALDLYRKTGNKNVAVTLGARGLVYFHQPEEGSADDDLRLATEYIPALPAVTRDPMGAGDALAATTAAAMKAGAPPVIACLLGDAAAAQEIQQLGNVPLEKGELMEFLVNLIPE